MAELQQELEKSRALWRGLKEENDRLAPLAKAAEKSEEKSGRLRTHDASRLFFLFHRFLSLIPDVSPS